MKKPLIGIVPLIDLQRESFWILPGYMQGIEAAGGIPVMLPPTENEDVLRELAYGLDGLLLTGGQDVDPALYRAEKSPFCGEICPLRDRMEQTLFRLARERDLPLLGICRGIQILNVCCGGTLYQDLPTEFPSEVGHCQRPPYDRPAHAVSLLPDAPLGKLLQKDRLSVNSYHHQAIKTLSPLLRPMAYSQDGLTEAVFLPSARFVWAVQWHPEFSFRSDPDSLKIFAVFVDACR